MDSPVELPDGTLRCRAHQLECCGICCVDYTFMREIISENGNENGSEIDRSDLSEESEFKRESSCSDNEEDEWDGFQCVWNRDPLPPLRSLKDRLFIPPNPTDTPSSLFKAGQPSPLIKDRMIRHRDRSEGLIMTDGSCLNNGRSDPTAGWAFVISTSPLRVYSGRLELKGSDGQLHPQTGNRAELRAIIAASQFRAWNGEQFRRMIFATDSEYVVRGVTEYMSKWLKNGWRNSRGRPVANRDLWMLLLEELKKWDERGLRVLFWHIPRELNELADRSAKLAAAEETVKEDFETTVGLLI